MSWVIYFITAFLLIVMLVYGYKKGKNINSILSDILYEKASKEIEEYLRKHETITFSEAKEIITELKGSVFWSRKAIIINDPIKYANIVLNNMVSKDKLLYYEYGAYRIYKLKYKSGQKSRRKYDNRYRENQASYKLFPFPEGKEDGSQEHKKQGNK